MACSAAVKSAGPGKVIRPSDDASTAQSAGGAVPIALVSASMACPGNTLAALAAATAAACRTPGSASPSSGTICPTSAGDSNRPMARTAWARTRGLGSLRPSLSTACDATLNSRASSIWRMRAGSAPCAKASDASAAHSTAAEDGSETAKPHGHRPQVWPK